MSNIRQLISPIYFPSNVIFISEDFGHVAWLFGNKDELGVLSVTLYDPVTYDHGFHNIRSLKYWGI